MCEWDKLHERVVGVVAMLMVVVQVVFAILSINRGLVGDVGAR